MDTKEYLVVPFATQLNAYGWVNTALVLLEQVASLQKIR
jgi:hypothetical protein